MKKRILLLDESGIFIRNALGGTKDLQNQRGNTTGGVFGYCGTLFGTMERFKPDHIICAVDSKVRPLFRKDIFPAYKANRKSVRDQIKDFSFQQEALTQFHKLFCIPRVEVPGYEADDVIASLATQYSEDGHEVFILSKDKDFVQLINKNTKLVLLGKHDKAQEYEVVTHKDDLANVFGIDPKKAQCYQGIVGDTADGYCGAPGVGPAAAQKLLAKYSSLEEIYKNLDDTELFFDKKGKPNSLRLNLDRPVTKEETAKYLLDQINIKTTKELVFLCRDLAKLETKMKLNREKLLVDYYSKINSKKLIEFFEDLDFYSFIIMLEGAEEEQHE